MGYALAWEQSAGYLEFWEGAMSLFRRLFLCLAVSAALPAVARSATAQTYPSRPVHLIVGFAAGGPSDVVARLIGQSLSERLGQQVVVDNRPGASGNIGTELVVKALPDGYTLLMCGLNNSVNTALFDDLSFNFSRDIAPVSSLIQTPGVMEVNPSFLARTVPEFIAYAKANPGKVNMATSGPGSSPDVYGALFKKLAGVNLVPVAYRGSGPALIDLIGGQVQVIFSDLSSSLQHIKAGKLRPLAVTTAARLDALPGVPALAEFLPGYEASTWTGIGAPRNTPKEIIEKLNQEINAALADPKMKARFAEFGATSLGGSPSDFGKLIAEETAKWAEVVKASGTKAE
jgi:tripartite-type tricarboxylate transporter receptor subunit TctC